MKKNFIIEDLIEDLIEYLDEYRDRIELDKIEQIREERKKWLHRESCKEFRLALDNLPYFQTNHLDISGGTVTIGHADEFSEENHKDFIKALKIFMPWRKGPFKLFGINIDAEWRSDLKWERILPHIEPLEGKRVADIGCNNGYYLFRMAHHKPQLAIGFDPTARYFYTFQLLQRYARMTSLHFELLGVEHIAFYRDFFHTVFCLGILYHHQDPIRILKDIKISMVNGGQLIVESQGIEGEESVALFPEKRYGKVPGTYFIPTPSCLVNWLKRAGFKNIECFFVHKMSCKEQRKTTIRIYVKAKNL